MASYCIQGIYVYFCKPLEIYIPPTLISNNRTICSYWRIILSTTNSRSLHRLVLSTGNLVHIKKKTPHFRRDINILSRTPFICIYCQPIHSCHRLLLEDLPASRNRKDFRSLLDNIKDVTSSDINKQLCEFTEHHTLASISRHIIQQLLIQSGSGKTSYTYFWLWEAPSQRKGSNLLPPFPLAVHILSSLEDDFHRIQSNCNINPNPI